MRSITSAAAWPLHVLFGLAGSLWMTAAAANDALVDAALERTKVSVTYTPAYVQLDYPNGDVPNDTGVCTDLVIRSFRALGLDLQRLVHEDMREHFDRYPKSWGLSRPDRNIDHRRVPNLETFFARHGKTLPITDQAQDYEPGDIVTWRLAGGQPHIGIVVRNKAPQNGTPLIVHNIGAGPKQEDVLFAHPIQGHFRFGDAAPTPATQ